MANQREGLTLVNSNSSYWLVNSERRLEGYSPAIGKERTPPNIRTRQQGLVQAAELFTRPKDSRPRFSTRVTPNPWAPPIPIFRWCIRRSRARCRYPIGELAVE
jgi:hypothetical protein